MGGCGNGRDEIEESDWGDEMRQREKRWDAER
jgi:hypothetical protein